MSDNYKHGDLIKVSLPDSDFDSVHVFYGYTEESRTMCAGRVITSGGTFHADHCSKYNGAIIKDNPNLLDGGNNE